MKNKIWAKKLIPITTVDQPEAVCIIIYIAGI